MYGIIILEELWGNYCLCVKNLELGGQVCSVHTNDQHVICELSVPILFVRYDWL